MHRRRFLIYASAMTSFSFVGKSALASPSLCDDSTDDLSITGYSQGFFEIRHQHEFKIPLSVLINPPQKGFTARCSSPLVGHTDFEGLRKRKDDKGNPLDLSQHTHSVSLTRDQLFSLAQGRHVTIDLDNFGHKFYFVANDATLQAIHSVN